MKTLFKPVLAPCITLNKVPTLAKDPFSILDSNIILNLIAS